MKLKELIPKLLQINLHLKASDYEIKVDLDNCEDPNVIKIELDNGEKTITIIQGNCGL